MHSYRSAIAAFPFWVFCAVVPYLAQADTVLIKAQGSSECGFFDSQKDRDKALLDAKRRAIEKYISGVKSQNEANRLIAMKGQLFEAVDEYVKDAVEIVSNKKDGRCLVTIQANIDRTMINKLLGDSFKVDSKKAGLKKKKVAFIFVAREVDTTVNVKTHTIDQSSESARVQSDESVDRSAKGDSSNRESSRGQSESESSNRSAEKLSENRAGRSDMSIRQDETDRQAAKTHSSESGSVSATSDSSMKRSTDASAEMEKQEEGRVRASRRGDTVEAEKSYRASGRARTAVSEAESGSMNASADRSYQGSADSDASRKRALDRQETLKSDSTSESGRDSREGQSARHESSSERNAAFTEKGREDRSYRGQADVDRNAENKVTEIAHSEKRNWRVSEFGTVNAQLTELFKEQGMRVSESLDGSEIMGQLARADSVNQIRPGDIRKTINAAKDEGIDFLLVGTLDVGNERIDRATGNTVREVLLNANVYDLDSKGKSLEKAAAVGNLNFSGLGATPDVAKNNALGTAVREASMKLIAQTREYILEAAGDE